MTWWKLNRVNYGSVANRSGECSRAILRRRGHAMSHSILKNLRLPTVWQLEADRLFPTVFKGEIWVLGGRLKSQEILRRVWIYNPARNEWRAGPSMPKPMDLLGVVTVGNKIHAVLESKYFVYDGATRKWQRGPSLKVPRHALALYAVGGRLYAIGGCIVPQLEDSPAVETLRLTR